MAKYKNENFGKKEKGKDGQDLYSSEYCANGGSGGFIYKNSVAFHEPWRYKDKNEIVYIPEYGFPENKSERVPADELQAHYTRQDLISLTNSEGLAVELFDELTWQNPDTLWNEWCNDSDENGYWIEARWAYEKVYLPEYEVNVDRKGQKPICGDEFSHVEWQDEEYRNYCLKRLTEIGCISKEDMRAIQKSLSMEDKGMDEQFDEIPEQFNYAGAVAESVEQEFNNFCAKQKQKSKDEILGDYLKIYAYSELHRYLTSKNTMLDYEDYQALYEDKGSILAVLYDEYLKKEYAHLTTDDDILDFVTDYNRKYHKNIFEGEAELG